MKCPSEVELNEFAEDRIESQRRWEIQEHLDQCEGCRSDLEGLDWVGTQLTLLDSLDEAQAMEHPSESDLAALAEGSADADLKAELLSHIGTCAECASLFGALPRPQRKPVTFRSFYGLAAAAAVVLIIGTFALTGRFVSHQQTKSPMIAEKAAPKIEKPQYASKPEPTKPTTVKPEAKPVQVAAVPAAPKPAAAVPPPAPVTPAKVKPVPMSKPVYGTGKHRPVMHPSQPRSNDRVNAAHKDRQLGGVSRTHRTRRTGGRTGYDKVQVAVVTPHDLGSTRIIGSRDSVNKSIHPKGTAPALPAHSAAAGAPPAPGGGMHTMAVKPSSERVVVSVGPGRPATPVTPAAPAAAAPGTGQRTEHPSQMIVASKPQMLANKPLAKSAAKRMQPSVAKSAGQKAKAQISKNTGKTIKSLASKSTHHKSPSAGKVLTQHKAHHHHRQVAPSATQPGPHGPPGPHHA